MPSAGFQLVAGRIPGERIATEKITSDTTFADSETQVASVTAPLVNGRTYRIRFVGRWGSDTSGDHVQARLRQDGLTGGLINFAKAEIFSTSATGADLMIMEGEFTASSTADKTFVASGERVSGTGTCRLDAEAGGPAFLYVDYISG